MEKDEIKEYIIRKMEKSDWPEVKKIYLEGIGTNLATFQRECPDYSEWDKGHCSHSRLIVAMENEVLAWTALTAVSSRCAYSGVAEVSIYVAMKQGEKGIGSNLLLKLMDSAEKNGIWTLQSSIMQENKASIKLHEKCGFRMVVYRERIGIDSEGIWRNTVLMEKRF